MFASHRKETPDVYGSGKFRVFLLVYDASVDSPLHKKVNRVFDGSKNSMRVCNRKVVVWKGTPNLF